MKLTSDLAFWEVTLRQGDLLTLRAHAIGEEGSDYVFVALMEGEPPYEYELLRVPVASVAAIEGGWPESRRSSTE